MTEHHLEYVRTRRGNDAQIAVRDGTSDLSLALGSFSNHWAEGHDEYNLANLHLDGVFVDIGAHIGIVSLAILRDNPTVSAILVEPFPENLELARATMEANDLTERVTFVQGSVGRSDITYGPDSADDRYVGNIGTHDGRTIKAKVYTLAALVKMAGGRIQTLKLDCEGGEWEFLDSRAIGKVDFLFGEWHGNTQDRDGDARLHALLDRTHEITELTDEGGIGLFRAVRK